MNVQPFEALRIFTFGVETAGRVATFKSREVGEMGVGNGKVRIGGGKSRKARGEALKRDGLRKRQRAFPCGAACK